MHTASFSEIQRVLADERSMTDAAEAHTERLPARSAPPPRIDSRTGCRKSCPRGAPSRFSTGALRGLYFLTTETLAGAEMSFEPLLPEDAQPLDERAAAPLNGVSGSSMASAPGRSRTCRSCPAKSARSCRDFDELTRVGVGAGESDEENESAYAELVEFVRVGVQLVFEELESLRERAGDGESLTTTSRPCTEA